MESENKKLQMKKVLIVGNPNVGKSVIFNNLTGNYATVSNYPGTTVEISHGKGRIGLTEYDIIDTPGMYSLFPITEEERVSQKIILSEKADILLHVIDAKNLERMLPFTFQLIEAGLPVILVLNIMDEAERMGIGFDIKKLESELNIPVIPTVSVTKRGMNLLKQSMQKYNFREDFRLIYDDYTELKIKEIETSLKSEYLISKRAVAVLILQNDIEVRKLIKDFESGFEEICRIAAEANKNVRHSMNYTLSVKRYQKAARIAHKVIQIKQNIRSGFSERLSRISMNPWTGIPILLAVLYFGLYKFVGQFGAGVMVNFIENTVFGKYINPHVTAFVQSLIPWTPIQTLFIGEYGIITLGIRYAVAIILPIVGTFFIVFAVIEDTGYLPRLAMLIDKILKKIGLSGRAIIPMVLGLGCGTMATMVTRTLETKRERIMATILLALAVPCSAQLGVIMSLFEKNFIGLVLWASIITLIFLPVGYIGAKLMPGEGPVFFMEVPPLRLPKLSNILIKTYSRMEWYFMEVFPLFILASVLIWIGQISGIFNFLVGLFVYPVRMLDLPDQASVVYFFGFFRRDYGAAGLYDLSKNGMLNGNQLLVAAVTMTLFLPCIAQFIMNIKERGWKIGVGISAFTFFFAFIVGYILSSILNLTGIQL